MSDLCSYAKTICSNAFERVQSKETYYLPFPVRYLLLLLCRVFVNQYPRKDKVMETLPGIWEFQCIEANFGNFEVFGA